MDDLLKTTERLMEGVWRKTTVLWRSVILTGRPSMPLWNEDVVRKIASRWREDGDTERRHTPFVFTRAEHRALCERIRKETEVWNRNNVTRTQAYWNFYEEFPELHWALLAHMVSRNGGWNMTDLKGEWLPQLLSPDDAVEHFRMLEACNALIFRDAYPQLKLYAESRRDGQPLFRLLPYFRVSAFMAPFWERFWETAESAVLTVALIVNEQHVIQRPVVEDPGFRARIFDSPAYRGQPFLQTSQVVFPVHPHHETRNASPTRLAGRVLERFTDLHERIEFGKCLYAVLFGYPKVLDGVLGFARRVPHSGSRADYWPQRFDPRPRKNGGSPPKSERSADEFWYSPTLEAAWPDQPLPTEAPDDWFSGRHASAVSYLTAPRPPLIVDMTFEHLLCLRKLQAAAQLAGQAES